MALVNRKRVNSTLRTDNMEFVVNICKDTNLNQSAIYDLAIDILKKELQDKSIFDLMKELKNNK